MTLSIFLSLKRFGGLDGHLFKVPSHPNVTPAFSGGNTVQKEMKEMVVVPGSLLFGPHPSSSPVEGLEWSCGIVAFKPQGHGMPSPRSPASGHPVLALDRPSSSIHSSAPSLQFCDVGEPLAQGHRPTTHSAVSSTGKMTELDAHDLPSTFAVL